MEHQRNKKYKNGQIESVVLLKFCIAKVTRNVELVHTLHRFCLSRVELFLENVFVVSELGPNHHFDYPLVAPLRYPFGVGGETPRAGIAFLKN